MDEYQRFQQDRLWQALDQVPARETSVGIMGLGVMGANAARVLTGMNYRLLGWSRSEKDIAGLQSFVGKGQLNTFLAQTKILVVLLPLSQETRKLIDQDVLWQLPRGAFVINAGRGELVATDALVDSLNSGHLAGAGLDVFDNEPLPHDHPILTCEQVVLTPHIADQTPEGIELLNEGAVSNVIAFLDGRPQNVVL